MGTIERKEREKHEMREMILSAAKNLFIQEGFDHVTIRRIAEVIEYSPATVYLYFADKDTILCALQEVGFRELYKRQQILVAIKNPAEKLRACGKIYIDFAMENQELYDLMFIMRAPMKAFESLADWNVGRDTYEVLQSIITDCIAQGYIKSPSPQIVCFSMWALMHGVVSIFIRDRAPMISKDQQSSVINGILDFTMTEILDK
ncbi:MAG: TetR/AcrR family transcriptional regulator [Bacteroidetes bacterium]|nr:TetR/AcrR family transcriptional regulator [Bacteroidota bacterium]